MHKRREQYETELAAYQRLRRLRIRSLHGVTIPRLRSWSDTDQIIRMDTVSPPFLLDFGGVLFEPPDFNEDVKAHWYATIEERYGSSAPLVHILYEALAARGIYYLDFRLSNLNLEGLTQG